MNKNEKRIRRKLRVRLKVFGVALRPRVSVFRSNRHIFAQIIDDNKSETLVSASDVELKSDGKKSEVSAKKQMATKVGELLAAKALKKKIKSVVFDRNGYKYHGRVKDFADGLRQGGLEV
jgi:large subunit ribosomal protein L18